MTNAAWYYKEGEKVLGPHSADEIKALYEDDKIDNFTYIYDDKTEEWDTMNEKIVLLKSHISTTSATKPLSVKKTPDEETSPDEDSKEPTPFNLFMEGFIVPWIAILLRKPFSQFLIDSGFNYKLTDTLYASRLLTIVGIFFVVGLYTEIRNRPDWWVTSSMILTVVYVVIWNFIIR